MTNASARTAHEPWALLLVVVVLLASIAACGSDDANESSSASAEDPVTETRIVEHSFGTSEVPADPQRIVTLGYMDQDYVLALGVVPVGVRDWFGDQPNAVWPWARELLEGAEPEKLDRELNYEAIAALDPDLIVAVSAGFDEVEYDIVNEIAPTITQPAGVEPFTLTWQEHTRHVGEILNREAEAEARISALEENIAEAVASHPEFDGSSFAFASVTGPDRYLYGPVAPASTFLTSLGFVVPDDIVELTDNPSAYHLLSEERIDLVDRDVVVWSEAAGDPGVAEMLADPLYAELPVHREGRDLFLGLDLYGGAFSFSTVLSLDLLVEDLVPDLALALDGDIATEPALAP